HAGHSHGPSAEYGCGLAPLEAYDLPLHIGALFILLVASTIGTFVPIFLQPAAKAGEEGSKPSSPLKRCVEYAFFICRHFGTGVILSTAFIHLLSHAFIYFSNECIGELAFESTSPAIAMGAVWLVFVIDFFLLRSIRNKANAEVPEAQRVARDGKISGSDSGLEDDEEQVVARQSDSDAERVRAQAKVQTWDVFALEAGIIFHSILIGVTLGASSGSGWVALLIAITFHQFFEGLALGSRIALLPRAFTSLLKKFVMGLGYSITTPLGIGIGIGVRQTFNSNDRPTLLVLGIFHSLSAGILLYTALVELIAGDFIHGKGLRNASTARCLAAIASLTVGAALMSILGKW
ncbi:Zinc/iron permease, partial [Violaceomyces palustris]